MVTPYSRGVLAGRDGAVVDRDHLGDVAVQHGRGAGADFLGDREQEMAVDRQLRLGVDDGVQRGDHRGDARLVVEMARVDVAVLEKFRPRIDGDDVADIVARVDQVPLARHPLVDAQLDVLPGDRQRVDFLVEGVAGRLERQDGAALRAGFGDDRDPRAFGEARRPGADRHQLEPAVLLQPLHLRAQRVDMGEHGAVRAALPPAQVDAHGAAAGQLVVDAARLEALREVMHDRIGIAGRARDAEQVHQGRDDVALVDRRAARSGGAGARRSGAFGMAASPIGRFAGKGGR